MANEELKEYAKQRNVKLWEVAEGLSIYDSTLSKWMRREMNPDMQKKIKDIIDEIEADHLNKSR